MKTQLEYFSRFSSIFSYAVDYGWINEPPVKKRFWKRFDKLSAEKITQFRIDQLNTLFQAPLYKGCRDDYYGYSTPGENRPRSGRFWLPLLALYQGVRLAEGCQFFCKDIGEEDGVSFINVSVGNTEE